MLVSVPFVLWVHIAQDHSSGFRLLFVRLRIDFPGKYPSHVHYLRGVWFEGVRQFLKSFGQKIVSFTSTPLASLNAAHSSGAI